MGGSPEHAFVVGSYTQPEGELKHFGTLLVGVTKTGA